jgi:hypothetical protein
MVLAVALLLVVVPVTIQASLDIPELQEHPQDLPQQQQHEIVAISYQELKDIIQEQEHGQRLTADTTTRSSSSMTPYYIHLLERIEQAFGPNG